jgi:hypothetical protein
MAEEALGMDSQADDGSLTLVEILRELSPEGTESRLTRSYTALIAPKSGFIGANVYPRFVWFYLNEELQQDLKSAGFEPERCKEHSTKRRDKNKFCLRNLGIDSVAKNKGLFSKTLEYSLSDRDSFGNTTSY